MITLTTDFGLADGYVGTMKGVILSIVPAARLVDLSHEIAPQSIRHAAYVLHAASPFFPVGTIHLAVVDPGVGGARRAMIVRTSRSLLVGPDNGLFTLFLDDEPEAACHAITNARYLLPRPSATFHGRDVFAPVAAHLAQGVPPAEFGPRITDPVRLVLPVPQPQPDGSWLAQVLYADHFGNLVTSVTEEMIQRVSFPEFVVGQQCIRGLRRAYADAMPGDLVALVGSSGRVEISVVNGSAARALDAGPDTPVIIRKRQEARCVSKWLLASCIL